jgi:hypothetical protein
MKQLERGLFDRLDDPLTNADNLRTIYEKTLESLERPYLHPDVGLYTDTGLAIRPAPADLVLDDCFASSRLPPQGDLVLNPALCGPVRQTGPDTNRRYTYASRPAAVRADVGRPNEVQVFVFLLIVPDSQRTRVHVMA